MLIPIEPIIKSILNKYTGCKLTEEICEIILEDLHNGLKFELDINLIEEEEEEENNDERTKSIVS